MRILIATSHRNIVGGVEKYLQAIIPSLADRGHQIALLCEGGVDPAQERIDSPELGLPVWSIAELGRRSALESVQVWNPDVVYSQGLENSGIQDELLHSYPTVLYAHNYVGTCATEQKCQSFPTPKPCTRRLGVGCLLLHYPRRCGGLHPLTMWKMYGRAVEKNRQLPNYDAVLVASAHMHHEFQQHGVNSERLHLVPLPNPQAGIDVSQRVLNDQPIILFIGRLTQLKGVDYLLRAVRIAAQGLAQVPLVTIAGDGPERRKLELLAQELNVSAEFLGWIRSEQKLKLMQAADVVAVPSLWPEPFGLVGIEAGSCGLPAVAYDVGGIRDWLIPGRSGELAPGDPPTVEGLAAAILRVLASASHYKELVRGARDVANRFSIEAHLSRLDCILTAARHRTKARVGSIAEQIYV